MRDITNNEMLFVLNILKSLYTEYNANSISKTLGISSMGALKIAKKLEKENIIRLKVQGKANFFILNLDDDYVKQYVKFLLKREYESANPYVKRWLNEIKSKIKSADSAILFGSVLRKYEDARDIDVLFITDQKRFSKLKKEIEDINFVNVKKIHPMFQNKEDIINNIKKNDKPLLSALRGIVIFGEDNLLELLKR